MLSAELFCGCGGLALGMSRAGFEHVVLAEWNNDAVTTLLHNKKRRIKHIAQWPITGVTDVRDVSWRSHAGKIRVVSGGPPCQPFGIGGKKRGHEDDRDMWPEAIRAVRETRPDAFLFENVRNLAGPRFQSYLEWIALHLRHPDVARRSNETYAGHLERLSHIGREGDYRVHIQVVNAADYGAPQIRHRVLIFGIASDLNIIPDTMKPTHSRDRLFWDQYVTGTYWDRHGIPCKQPPKTGPHASRIARLKSCKHEPEGRPWVTVRDALMGLGEPDGVNNHVMQSGARVYPGHTGSLMDLPAKALKAGDHGVPGGENMAVRDDGSVRYFTTREAARLVGLPDNYVFPRSWTESMRQLGNAVPTQLGEAAGLWIKHLLMQADKLQHAA